MPLTESVNLVLRNKWAPMDADAAAYITAVETADGQALEETIKIAIDNFVLGCKADGIWTAIKASCILAGARTKEGAIVPLANASAVAPTLNGTAGGWNYNRETGLAGNGTDNFISSGRNNNAETSQNTKHLAVYTTTTPAGSLLGTNSFTAGHSCINVDNVNNFFNCSANTSSANNFMAPSAGVTGIGFLGVDRSGSSSARTRRNNRTTEMTTRQFSATPVAETITVMSALGSFSSTRVAFYSIGESLDLALLDARVTVLINAIGAAIP